MERVILIFLLVIIPYFAFAQERRKEEIKSAMEESREEAMKDYFLVFDKVYYSLKEALKNQKISEDLIKKKARDSTFFIINNYRLFNEMFLASQQKTKVPKPELRRVFIDSLCRVNGLHPYFPLLDSLYERRLYKIKEITNKN